MQHNDEQLNIDYYQCVSLTVSGPHTHTLDSYLRFAELVVYLAMAKYYDQVQNELSLSYLYVSVSVVVSRKSRVLPSHYQSKDDNKTVIDSLEQFVALYVRSNPAFPSTENEVPSPPVNAAL